MSTTRQRLIDTAFELFGRSGFHAVGLDRILDEVGVSKQTFYNHFESKDDLILAVLKHRHEVQVEMVDNLLTQMAGHDPRARLEAIFDVLEAWMNDPDWRGCIFMSAASEFPVRTEPAHQMAAEHTRVLLENLQYMATLAGAKDPRALAEQLNILIDGAITYRHVTGDHRAIEIAKKLAQPLFAEHFPEKREPAPRMKIVSAV